MYNAFKSIRRDRAAIERDRVLFEAMLSDDEVDDAMDLVESTVLEDVSDDEIEELIDRIPESDANAEDEQIDRILDADDEGLDADEILGIDADMELSDVK